MVTSRLAQTWRASACPSVRLFAAKSKGGAKGGAAKAKPSPSEREAATTAAAPTDTTDTSKTSFSLVGITKMLQVRSGRRTSSPHPRSAGAPVPAVASLGAADKAPFVQGYFVEFLRWSEDRCALPPRVANAWGLIYCIDSGVIGVNGSGKSSLMKIISARRPAASPDIISRAQTHRHIARSHAMRASTHHACTCKYTYSHGCTMQRRTRTHTYVRLICRGIAGRCGTAAAQRKVRQRAANAGSAHHAPSGMVCFRKGNTCGRADWAMMQVASTRSSTGK